ncbi:MAG: hypothetical protein WD069_04850 [Planctomycetales bacterium]
MNSQVLRFWRDEGGFVVSAELVLVLTIGVLAMLVGLHGVASAVNNELVDVANAFGTIDQSFVVNGFRHGGFGGFGFGGLHAFKSGSGFIDTGDFCDCAVIVPVPAGAKGSFGVASGAGVIGGGAPVLTPVPAPGGIDCPPGAVVPQAPPLSPVPCNDCPEPVPAPPVLPQTPGQDPGLKRPLGR